MKNVKHFKSSYFLRVDAKRCYIYMYIMIYINICSGLSASITKLAGKTYQL